MIAIQLLVGIGLLALVCVGAYFYSQKCIEWFLHKDSDDLDFVLESEGVPARWCAARVRKIERMRTRGASEAQIERARARANKRYLRRMNRIMAFARGAPVFESESHRQVALQDLARIRSVWERREYLHEPY
jgi:hypothetical protein